MLYNSGGFFFAVSPLFRTVLFNLHRCGYYSLRDFFEYFYYKKYKEFSYYGIYLFVGMFGKGKTLSMTHFASNLYSRFGDSIRFISNYDLKDIPYIPLVNFQQLVDLGENETEYQGTVVLIDEVENILSHRNFANFPMPLLHMLTQQRKKKVLILSSAQRFAMVDKLYRSITTYVIDCNKYWRLQHQEVYDAWDLENATNTQLIKRLSNSWWFVRNRDYNAYDTSQFISKHASEDFISNKEILINKGDVSINMDAVNTKHQSNIYKKSK